MGYEYSKRTERLNWGGMEVSEPQNTFKNLVFIDPLT